MSTVLTVDKEESLFRGYIPFNEELLKQLEGSDKITDIIFNGNGYVTDALLHLIKRKIKQPLEKFSELKNIDLTGCNLITDHGIRCLLDILESSVPKGVQKIDLNGCSRLTDNTVAFLLDMLAKHESKATCHIMGTSVSYLGLLSGDIQTVGCPSDIYKGRKIDSHDCQVLVSPHSSMSNSFSTYLRHGTVVDRKSATIEDGLQAGDWNVTLTELSASSCLFESVTNSDLSQVIIPFDSTAEPKSVKEHVMSTISRVVAKEARHHSFPKQLVTSVVGSMTDRPFLDIHLLDRLVMYENDEGRPVLRNVSTSESSIGVYISNAQFSRTNSYFEVEVSKLAKPPEKEGSETKFAVLIGCLYDLLFSSPSPMDSTSDTGGYVDGLQVKHVGQKIGFGIEGEWISEYVPSSSALFYFMEDGVKSYGNEREATPKENPTCGMYPLVSVLGEQVGEVTLPKLVQPPKKKQDELKKENRWIETMFTKHNDSLMIDKKGRMQLQKNGSYGNNGKFYGRHEMTAQNKSFSIVLERLNVADGKSKSEFFFGVDSEVDASSTSLDVKSSSCVFLHVSLKPFQCSWVCSECKNENSGSADICVICAIGKVPEEAKNPKNWSCKECQHLNDVKDVICSSCKKGVIPEGFGQYAKEVWSEINMQTATKHIEETGPVKEGDTFSVTVTDGGGNDMTQVEFFHNETQICVKKFPFKPKKASRLVPMIRLLNTDDVLHLKNYKPTYRRPAPFKDKITVGRNHFLKVSDTGEMEDSGTVPTTTKLYSTFVSKVPFNKQLLEFEITILDMNTSRLCGIGAAGFDFDSSKFVGWIAGSIGYHGDNGQIYYNSGSAKVSSNQYSGDKKFYVGDVIAMKVLPLKDGNPLEFDEDDELASQQTVKLQFTKNGTVVHEEEFEILTESLYPALSLKDAKVKVSNFYAETEDSWKKVETKTEQTSKENKKTDDTKKENYTGTEFLVVGVGKKGSDPSGKVQILQQQVSLKDWTELEYVTGCIKEMERNLGELDFQEQYTYGQLCAIEDNMRSMQQNGSRISFHCLTLDENEKLKDALLNKISDIQDKHKAYQQMKYRKSTEAVEDMEAILKILGTNKITKMTSLKSELPNISGPFMLPMLKAMHSEGKLLLFDLGEDYAVCDIRYLFDVEDKLQQLLPTEIISTNSMVTCIGQNSHVWTSNALITKVFGDTFIEDKIDFLKRVMEKAFGVIPLQCIRSSVEDEQTVYVINQNLSTPPVSMADFLPLRDRKDFVVMKQTYTIPVGFPAYMLALVISNTTRYGRPLLITEKGVVYQSGCVQTIIFKDADEKGETVLVIESRCYMPSLQEDRTMSKQTASYVQDFTWNVFCIFTDIVDDLFRRSNVVAMATKDIPVGMVNVSVGCKHKWRALEIQTVNQSVCTMCNLCIDKGDHCKWNGLVTEYLRDCECQTNLAGCKYCGICVSCAAELWGIRTRLRPFSLMMTAIDQTVKEKFNVKPSENGEAPGDKWYAEKQPNIPLDPFMYNEVEFTNLSSHEKIICLKKKSDGSILQAYPGKAHYVEDLKKVDIKKAANTHIYKLNLGDQIQLRLSDELGTSYLKSQEKDTSGESELQVDPQYFAFVGREVKVIHETGVLVYETASPAIPVGQFISCRPMTKECPEFSVRILSPGEGGYIAIGLVPQNYPPNRQPGWNSQSIGYHADDGGVFLESGSATRTTLKATIGDIMSFHCDFEKKKGWFRRNGEKCIELNLNPSRLGYYPCVGFHSKGEAVQLLQKDVWTPRNETERSVDTPAFATYKYGNLWISPGKVVNFTKIGSEYCGWIILHNPLKEQVGFKVTGSSKTGDTCFGVIEDKKNWVHHFKVKREHIMEAVTVEWLSLEAGRTYTREDTVQIFGDTLEYKHQAGFQHRVKVKIIEAQNVVEELPTVSVTKAKDVIESCMRLKVYKNHSLIEEYFLKQGVYNVSVETDNKESKFILRYPKCPSYTYPKTFQKGMKMIAYLESMDLFAECIVVDLYSGGKMLAIEYSPKDKNVNTTICVKANSPALQFSTDSFKGNESNILPYESRNTPVTLTKTFVNAPPFLLSQAAQNVMEFIDKDWKSNVLKRFNLCAQVFTRLTVQENNVCKAVRSLMEWLKDDDDMYLYTFLPRDLSVDLLVYPNLTTIFKDIAVHRPCFSSNEMKLIQELSGFPNNRMWKIPIHYVDIPGIVPDTALPVEALYGDWKTVWTYMALIGQKLNLTSYKNLIKGDISGLSQNQVEKLFFNMLQSYTSLCGIYNAAWGGVQYTPTNEDRHEIKDAIRKKEEHIKHFPGIPQTDSDALFKFTNSDKYAVCKAHCLNNDVTDVMLAEKEITFNYDYFEPYLKSVSVFNWSLTTLKDLPGDFFEKFENLQYFSLGSLSVGNHMGRLKALPGGLHNAKSLQLFRVRNTAVTELPSDLFMSPTVVLMELKNMPIKSLPEEVVENSDMKTLTLDGLLLSSVPDNLGRLESLNYLSLNQNPITSLPASLKNLKNLKTLDLSGAPWFTRETCRNTHHVVLDAYNEWHAQYPVCKNYMGGEVIENLFEEFDINRNGSLDEEELAVLNLKLFFDFPRIGIKDINDDVTGGIPQVVFHLESLSHLILNYNAITMVPPAINNLQNLQNLSLNHNPLLESLPGTLGHLPNINKINITSCPMLRTPPNEVVSRGFDSVKAYLKKLAGGFTECRRTKLMVVGLGGAGKTSLLRALMSENKVTAGTEKETPTDGIDIVPWTVKSKDNREVTFSTWDFAGQAVYYNTHQFFLSKRAVYLLLWSMRQGYEHAGLDFWLSSISCHAPGTPIIVIGTQCDLIPQAEMPEKQLRDRYPQIASFHQVSSISGTGIAELQDDLLDITLQQGYMGEKIPQVWLNFEKRILAERLTKVSYIKWDVAKQYAMEQGIYDEKDVRMAVQLLHDLGTVQYFDNDFLRDYVVINPQWIVNVMACVVSAQDSPIQKNLGRFLHSDIPVVWKDYDPDLHKWLLRLTEDFDLTFPLPKEPVNIVPCLLPAEEPEDLKWPSVRDKKGVRETKMVYKFAYLPSGLFNRAQVRLFQFSDGKKLWKKGSLLSKNKHLALIKQSDNTELVVFVQGPRPENILFLIHEVFESIIEESFHGVSYDLLVPCPDCLTKEGTFDPCLLNAELIQRAKDLKAPFLQCYKYFHWISMTHLEEKLPTTSRDVADFDIQLQQSIVALEEINSDLIRDIAIIYSSANVPSPGDKDALPPSLIRDDVLKWGYSCWFADSMETVSSVDLTTAFKHCKVLIALVSDEFERDTKCRDMFLYAKETMNKEIITVVLGESSDWMAKDLGMKIGNQERKLMAKNMHRYVVDGGRRDELKKWLEEKILQSRKEEDSLPEIFLSYCWSNSHEAQEKSGKHLPAALGWSDPRNLKAQLQENGLNCWIDVEYVGREKKGIFRDMANGIRNSKVMLACVSDEYADSDNCMMELRFGILNLELPLVVAVVGTGTEWKETEVAMLLRRSKAPEVHLQKENTEGCKTLVKYLKDSIINVGLSKKSKKKDNKAKLLQEVKEEKKENQSSSIAYQEEYELIQRKFIRHITSAISARDSNPLPRLIVIDFMKSASVVQGEDGRESSVRKSVSKSRKILRPKSASRSRDRLQIDESVFDDDVEDWSRESFCIKVLCEHEEGWHVCEEKYPLAFRNNEQLESYLYKAAPYLYRIYSILRQSPIKLNCFTGGKNGKGEAYQSWIRSESDNNLDFIGAMMHLRSELSSDEASEFLSCLARCRLPSGKIIWLCNKHQNLTRVSKLSTGSSGGSYNVQKVLFSEDKLLMENVEKSDLYKKLRSVKSNQVTDSLPAPVPIPQFTPKIIQSPPEAPEVKGKPPTPQPPKPPTPQPPKPPTPNPPKKEEVPPPPPKEPPKQSGPPPSSPPKKESLSRKSSKQNLKSDDKPSLENKADTKDKQSTELHGTASKSEKVQEATPREKATPIEKATPQEKATPPAPLLKTYSKADVQEQIRTMVLDSMKDTSLIKRNKRTVGKSKSNANVYSTDSVPSRKEVNAQPKNGFVHIQQQAVKAQKRSTQQPVKSSLFTSDYKPAHSRIVRGSTVRRDQSSEENGGSPLIKEDLQVNMRIKSSDSENSQSKDSTTRSDMSKVSVDKKQDSTKGSDIRKVSVDRKQARQIKVKEFTDGKPSTKSAGLKATGTTIGQTKGGEMPLPNTTSRACVLQ